MSLRVNRVVFRPWFGHFRLPDKQTFSVPIGMSEGANSDIVMRLLRLNLTALERSTLRFWGDFATR